MLSVKTPTTYLADGNVEINDRFGEFFYAINSGQYFNLPVGEYKIVKGSIVPDSYFKPAPQIPQVDPNIKPGMRVTNGHNPNKATYFADRDMAMLDDNIIRVPFKPARIFCVVHEKGHTKFRPPSGTMAKLKDTFSPDYPQAYANYLEAECNCDRYAYNVMVRNGYNPSQVRLAIRMIFRPDNERIKILDDDILKVNNYHII